LKELQIKHLQRDCDLFHAKHGAKKLNCIYGCGEIQNPNLFLIFMNPTARNISSQKDWQGLKAPWLGTKNVWRMLFELKLLDPKIWKKIHKMKPNDWNNEFANEVYEEVKAKSMYITNFVKATFEDAKSLKNNLYKESRKILIKEIIEANPKTIISFGNQVSSTLFEENVKVSEYRKKHKFLILDNKQFKVFPLYYPVGQGARNIEKAKKDIHWVMEMINI
jgi:uracil-DNA glycosylase